MDINSLYNKFLKDSRNPYIYKNYIEDTLNNKLFIFLIFLSKFFNNISKNNKNYQLFFDFIFNRIETDLREIGYGDMSVNKKMKVIVTKFYSILVDFKSYANLSILQKSNILMKYFSKIKKKDDFIEFLNKYFVIDNVEYNDTNRTL